MIYQAILLLDEAERRIRRPNTQRVYESLDGWWRRSAHKIDGKNNFKIPEEPAVSEAIVEQMELAKQDFILNAHRLEPDIAGIDTLEFHAEAPRKRKTGIGRRAKPTDFRFYRSGIGELDLRIEAKVLIKEPDIAREYLSQKNGLGRFSDPSEPYTDAAVGGMIAYTLSADQDTWLTSIRDNMAASSPNIPTFHHSVIPNGQSVLFCRVPFNYSKSPEQSEVLVFHHVLEFDSDPPARIA